MEIPVYSPESIGSAGEAGVIDEPVGHPSDEAAWGVVAPILDVWNALPPRHFPNYAAGTWGPKEADELIGRDGRQWRRIDA